LTNIVIFDWLIAYYIRITENTEYESIPQIIRE